jgi:hypothetical protein
MPDDAGMNSTEGCRGPNQTHCRKPERSSESLRRASALDAHLRRLRDAGWGGGRLTALGRRRVGGHLRHDECRNRGIPGPAILCGTTTIHECLRSDIGRPVNVDLWHKERIISCVLVTR